MAEQDGSIAGMAESASAPTSGASSLAMAEQDDSIAGMVESLVDTMNEKRKSLEDQEAGLKKARLALEQEKAAMTQKGISEGDVLDVNIGGEVVTEKRSTFLLAPEGSLLHSMFSGRWENSLDRDSQGRIFLSFTPKLFQKVLSFLRCLRMAPPGVKAKYPVVTKDAMHEFRLMVDYLGLANLIYSFSFDCPSLQLRSVQGNVQLSGGNTVASYYQGAGLTAVIGLDTLPNEDVTWKVSVVSMTKWIFIGIIGSDTASQNSPVDSTSYGWACSEQVYSGGQNISGHGGWTSWSSGDTAILRLRPAAGVLQMYCKRLNRCYELSGLQYPGAQWRIHINLCDSSSHVRIAHAEPAEAEVFAS